MTTASRTAQHVGLRLRDLRTGSGLSVRTLASKAGFSPSFISQVELGQASPSIDSLERIARALGLTLSDFFAQTASRQRSIVSADDRTTLTSAWSRARIESLTPAGKDHHIEAVMVTFDPGGRTGSELHTHPSDEFALVFDGEVVLTLENAAYVMTRGDSVTIPAGTPHTWRTAGEQSASVVIVSSRLSQADPKVRPPSDRDAKPD